MALARLGCGLHDAGHYEDALSVKKVELAMLRRVGPPEEALLIAEGSIACTYGELGQREESLSMERDVYSGWLKLEGEEHESTLLAANNYADSLRALQHFEDARSLLRKAIPVARRVLGESDDLTLRMRWNYARSVCEDTCPTLAELREAVTTLEDTKRIAQRVLGGAHPLTMDIEDELRDAQDALYARGLP